MLTNNFSIINLILKTGQMGSFGLLEVELLPTSFHETKNEAHYYCLKNCTFPFCAIGIQ